MFQSVIKLFRAPEFTACREEINRQNRLAIRTLAVSGLPLSVANIFAQTFFSRRELLSLRCLWMLLYFCALLLLERRVLPRKYPHSTAVLYLAEAPILIIAILLGTVWDPNHQALTFLMFTLAMPVFILDRPLRLLSVSLGWNLVFLGVCLLVKDPSTHRGDFFHVLEFFLASCAVSFVVLNVRLESLRNLSRMRYHLEHDALTGARNRRSLENRVELYVGKPLVLLLGDLDQLILYNDFYGMETGDEMLRCFAQTLTEEFGEEHAYHMGADEMLCLGVRLPEAKALERMGCCREKLRGRTFGGNTISLTCAFGYVTGTPATAKEFHEMIQLADIYAHKAHKAGLDQTTGGPFNAGSLRAGIIESSISTHARVYETDHLTGLPSMSYFLNHSEELLEHFVDYSRLPMVGILNLVHFRAFNAEFGYAKGDALLSYTAGKLKEYFNGRYICYLSGSQFCVLCFRDEAEAGLTLLNAALRSYMPGFAISAKAGFVLCREGDTMLSLLDKAKAAHDAIYDVPDETLRFYDEKLDAENHFRQYLVSHVDEAVQKGWHKVYYQPIVRALTGEICNEEALSRWDDPNYGFLMPFQFVPVLEEERLIYKLTLHVVRQVLADFRLKLDQGLPIVPVSVNLSRHDLEQCDMVREIGEMVDEAGFSRRLIAIEITESSFAEDKALLESEVRRFRAGGFDVWMDDFGSEYSTLNLLRELDFNLIKVDMEFMRDFSSTGKNMIIVSNVIEMARRMGVTTLVEGVETEEQYRFLRNLGVEKLQGFLFNKPNSLDYIIKKIQSHSSLTFENAKETPYYEAVGKEDLKLRHSYGEALKQRNAPSGILEYRDELLACLRGDEDFVQFLCELGLLPVSRMGVSRQALLTPTPEPLEEGVRRAVKSEDWIDVELEAARARGLTLRLRRIAQNPVTGAVALLCAFPPVRYPGAAGNGN